MHAPDWLTEEIPPRGSPEHPYSAQKAEVEGVLEDVLKRRRKTTAWVFRPCVVAGPDAQMMLQEIPYYRLSEAMPDAVARLIGWIDRYLVDGVLNVLSALTLRAGDRLRGLQTGLAQDYVYGVALGVLVLFVLAQWGLR